MFHVGPKWLVRCSRHHPEGNLALTQFLVLVTSYPENAASTCATKASGTAIGATRFSISLALRLAA